MRLEEMLAYNGKGGAKGLARYQELLIERDRLGRKTRKCFDEKDWLELSMSCFNEDEHDTAAYKKYESAYEHATDKLHRLEKSWLSLALELSQYIEARA